MSTQNPHAGGVPPRPVADPVSHSGVKTPQSLRAPVLGGLLYALPYALWLFAGLAPGPAAPDLSGAHTALLWTQALALTLLLPALAQGVWPRDMTAMVLLQAVPWPLFGLFVLTGSATLAAVVAGQGALALASAALVLLWGLARRAAAGWRGALRSSVQALAVLGLLAAAVGVWT